MPHTWTYEDDVLTFYIYRYEADDFISLNSVARHIGFNDTGSLKMRVKNFQAVDGKIGGLENYAQLTEQVYNEYQSVSQETHREKCLKIMEIA
ncbi:hypothetical protein SPONN_1344 [uncultured Candidatus Thioglobus sp.]|nr:hypothetical protein SPONN_1344 [uncultured Candidatus Thioglobus sp.]